MTLEEIIRKRLEEANIAEATATKPVVKKADTEDVTAVDKVDVTPEKKKTLTKESLDEMTQEDFDKIVSEDLDEESKAVLATYTGKTKTVVEQKQTAPEAKKPVSEQVAALLETEGLSEEFKASAVTIFEAAVTDRVLTIQEGLRTEFDSQLAEAKTELDKDIDGFLTEAIQKWTQDNEVAIKTNFKSQLAESFMDGLTKLIAEHNIEVPEGKEDALVTALGEVDKLNEAAKTHADEVRALTEQVNAMKAEKILESFKSKMTQTEFDRFKSLTESVKFGDETQYEKQLNVVLENFGAGKEKKTEVAPITEVALDKNSQVINENSDVSAYAAYINGNVR